jgi:glycosyltransferase involved in cell wall biosynthesis
MVAALIITVYNRPGYLKKCFESVKQLKLPRNDIRLASIYVIDDNSEEETKQLCREFCIAVNNTASNVEAYCILKTENLGIKDSIKRGAEIAFEDKCDIVINIDGDSLLKPDALLKILTLKKAHPDNIVSGFNCVTTVNPNVFEREDHYLKHYCNGINFCFNKEEYEKYIKPGLEKHGNWDYNASVLCKKDTKMFVVTKPSVVQHIGFESSMGHYSANGPDIAQDFKMLSLPTVTLFGIDAHDPDGIIRAAGISQRDIEFGSVNIITERIFPGANADEGRKNYSKFKIKELTKHFNTEHVLTIHSDGYVLNWEAWDNKWLEYDYIGAVWDHFNEHQVGNGGFSLRSKRLCNILAQDDTIDDFHAEDDKICRKYRPYLEKKYGIKFAPVEIAKKFSIEGWGLSSAFRIYNGEFGFHGYHLSFKNSHVPEVLWPRRKEIKDGTGNTHPGRFTPAAPDSTVFPNFLPEKFRPKTEVKINLQDLIPKKEKHVKLLILCGGNKEAPWDRFTQAQRETWGTTRHPNTKTIFYRDGPETKWFGDLVEVGTHGDYFNAHWRHKLAIDAVWDMDWDIIFRCHGSSYVDKAKLYEIVKNLPTQKLYGGWLIGAELPAIEWNGFMLQQDMISGAGIFYSRDIADILRKQTPEGKNIEDDVLAGRILHSNGYNVTFVNRDRVDMQSIKDYRPSYHYRLKSNDREADIKLMYELHKKITGQ